MICTATADYHRHACHHCAMQLGDAPQSPRLLYQHQHSQHTMDERSDASLALAAIDHHTHDWLHCHAGHLPRAHVACALDHMPNTRHYAPVPDSPDTCTLMQLAYSSILGSTYGLRLSQPIHCVLNHRTQQNRRHVFGQPNLVSLLEYPG